MLQSSSAYSQILHSTPCHLDVIIHKKLTTTVQMYTLPLYASRPAEMATHNFQSSEADLGIIIRSHITRNLFSL